MTLLALERFLPGVSPLVVLQYMFVPEGPVTDSTREHLVPPRHGPVAAPPPAPRGRRPAVARGLAAPVGGGLEAEVGGASPRPQEGI